jgi:hypothetical protein
MGDGAPGTGKTTLIQMMAGLIHGYCEVAGYPFRYRNLSTDNIDSYQGKSGQNAKAFINEITDPTVIGFGTIDDIDTLAGKRGDRQSSAGQLEITAGADGKLRGREHRGAGELHLRDVLELSRERGRRAAPARGRRFLVDGPQTRADYIDILALLLGKNHQIPSGDHDLFAAQAIQRAVAKAMPAIPGPRRRASYGSGSGWSARWAPSTRWRRSAPTSRRSRRWTRASPGVRSRTSPTPSRSAPWMWRSLTSGWRSRTCFLRRNYETKSAMIRELRRPITVEMVLQEINRYADSEFRYADKSDEAAIEAAVRDMGRMEEAKRRYLAQRAAP